mgnify:CR=1 FL=1
MTHFIAIVKQQDKDAEREEVRRRFLEKLAEQIAERVEVEYDSTNGYINIYKCRLKEDGLK